MELQQANLSGYSLPALNAVISYLLLMIILNYLLKVQQARNGTFKPGDLLANPSRAFIVRQPERELFHLSYSTL